MPLQPGESLLLTLFADIHYYFSPPSSRPAHDRFDKGSYLYLYHNSTQRRVRVEAANAAGTPNQDAFSGNLDLVVFKNTYKHPTLFSLSVDRLDAGHQPGQMQWCLPAFDRKNEQKYLYPITSMDIYLWTESDAAVLLDALDRTLPPNQLDLTRMPPPAEHRDSMSPVVQQLERAVIREPEQNHARVPSAASCARTAPPTSIVAYNPAAPAAPEPIAHREKTPPPPDAASGNGLSDGAMHEQGSYSTPYQQHQAFPGPMQRNGSMQFAGPPSTAVSPPASQSLYQGGFARAQPPQYASQTQYANDPQQQTVSYVAQSAGLQSPFPPTPSMPPAYGQHTPLQSPLFTHHTPLASPGLPQHTPLQSPGFPPPPPGPPPTGHTSSGHSAPPVGGYSGYQYTQQAQQPSSQAEAYNIHNQAYRPTEAEAAHGHGSSKPLSPPVKPGGFEDRVAKLEKGVGRFFKKLDQKM